jgi:hypothetical protein
VRKLLTVLVCGAAQVPVLVANGVIETLIALTACPGPSAPREYPIASVLEEFELHLGRAWAGTAVATTVSQWECALWIRDLRARGVDCTPKSETADIPSEDVMDEFVLERWLMDPPRRFVSPTTRGTAQVTRSLLPALRDTLRTAANVWGSNAPASPAPSSPDMKVDVPPFFAEMEGPRKGEQLYTFGGGHTVSLEWQFVKGNVALVGDGASGMPHSLHITCTARAARGEQQARVAPLRPQGSAAFPVDVAAEFRLILTLSDVDAWPIGYQLVCSCLECGGESHALFVPLSWLAQRPSVVPTMRGWEQLHEASTSLTEPMSVATLCEMNPNCGPVWVSTNWVVLHTEMHGHAVFLVFSFGDTGATEVAVRSPVMELSQALVHAFRTV